MNVHVRLRVGMIEREAGCGEALELRADLGGELGANSGAEEEAKTGTHEIGQECPVCVNQRRNSIGPQDWAPMHQHDVQTDGKARHSPRAFDCVVRRGRSNHKARCAQDALSMRTLDRLVDFRRRAEIVSADNNAFQLLDDVFDNFHGSRND